jgi:hypothetical protein
MTITSGDPVLGGAERLQPKVSSARITVADSAQAKAIFGFLIMFGLISCAINTMLRHNLRNVVLMA